MKEDKLKIHALYSGFHSITDSLNERLEHAKYMLSEKKSDIHGYFSYKERNIFKKIILYDSVINKDFLESISENNILIHENGIYEKINELQNCRIIKEYSEKSKCKYLTKWFDAGISPINKMKIDTIVNDQIYLANPAKFNDRFDSQIYVSELLSESIISDYFFPADDSIVPLEQKILMKKQLYFIQEMLNFNYVICFSENDPLSFYSSIMWGHYGGNGRGFALQYSTEIIEEFLRSWSKASKASSLFLFESVNYENEHSPYSHLSQFLWQLNKKVYNIDSYSSEKAKEAIIYFLLNKNEFWKHEREARLILRPSYDERDKNVPTIPDIIQYMDDSNQNNAFQIFEIKRQSVEKNKQNMIKFCKPCKIILGWDFQCDPSNDHFKRLENYAKNNNIEIGYIDKFPDYKNNLFSFNLINT